jgi:hypothetical protein
MLASPPDLLARYDVSLARGGIPSIHGRITGGGWVSTWTSAPSTTTRRGSGSLCGRSCKSFGRRAG